MMMGHVRTDRAARCALFLVLLPTSIGFVNRLDAATAIPELGVTALEPARNALTAAVTTAVSVTFDRPVDPSTITAPTFHAFGRWSGAVSGVFSFSNADQTVTLTSSRPFSAGERVMVILSHDIRGADGAALRAGGFSYQFWTKAEPATLEFRQIDVISTNGVPGEHSQPYGGTATDLNQDGWLDLTIINEVTADLRIFMNSADGSGLFEPFLVPTEPIGTFASPNEAADFNLDGLTDVCIGNQGVDSVSIVLGAGDGTFVSNQVVTVGDQPRGIAVLDADGDGDVDIVNTNFNGSSLSTLFNDGNGVFGAPVFWDAGGNRERALAVADMNNDGLLDLVIGAQPTNRVIVAAANGDGTFTAVSTQDAGGPVWMLVTGDVNGDGNEDVATANSGANNGAILLGDGAGHLLPPQTYPTDPFAIATDVADMDGDGDLDWVTSSFNGNWLLFVNDGTGTFTQHQVFDSTSAASCSLPFDIDNDGDLDLALVDEVADELIIMRQCGSNPAECQCAVAAAPQSDPVGIKNRFLSVVGGNPSVQTAVRVTFVDLPPAFSAWNGAQLWVGPQGLVSQNGSAVAPIEGSANFNASRLQCEPFFADWSALGVVHVFHEGIVPEGVYQLQEIAANCSDLLDENNYSTALGVSAARWGDTLRDLSTVPPGAPDGVVAVVDVLGILGRFVSDPTAIGKPRADLEPACLDLLVNIADVLSSIQGFQGIAYPFVPLSADPCQSPCVNPLP